MATTPLSDDVVVVDDGSGVVRLNRPDRANSVTPAVVTALGDAVAELGETDGVRAVVLTGTGSVFCAGPTSRTCTPCTAPTAPTG